MKTEMENASRTVVMPAEWQPQSGILLTWPHADTDWRPYLEAITETYVQLVKAITPHELVLIAARDVEAVNRLLHERLPRELWANVRLSPCDCNDTWARDHGPISLVTPDEVRLLDFRFNGWGDKFPADKDNAISRHLYERNMLHGTMEDDNDFILEGGSIESDGRGTIFTTSRCLLAPHRNQPLTRAQIEQQLMHRLHAQRVVWLDHGQLAGDDTDGHIDTIVRTAPDDTLLYVGCDDTADTQYDDFLLLERQLHSLRTIDGKPYRLLRLPMPRVIYDDDGNRLPATYANFLVINEAVICPVYGQPDNDRRALATIVQAFPHRQTVAIDARTIIRQHGSIHCLTMQFPMGVIR